MMIVCSTEHIRTQDGQIQHLREELTFVTEEMKKHVLEKEVLQQEKAELNETLSRTELSKVRIFHSGLFGDHVPVSLPCVVISF